ncbi:YidC/Oxa1 family membrane protein insertase [Streptacidiphilus sp. N1-3]|uniref:Membrane protein insertase YidC n=1 Tax=Streptacidiphilus alkalitolerans TaxID=3342712 RepID=A0ABV6WUE0_9ACTN
MSVFAFLDVPAEYAQHAATALAGGVHPLLGATATAAVIVLTTALVRLALHPLARLQVRGEKLRTRIAPQLKELTKRHKGDPARLREAQVALYRAEGASPLSGLLPSLLMWPFIAVLYRLFSLPVLGGHANTLLTGTLAGIPLGTHLTGALPGQLPVFLALYALLALVGLIGFRRARRGADPTAPGASVLPYLSFGTVLFAAFVPLSAGLYLLTTTSWTLVERALLRS